MKLAGNDMLIQSLINEGVEFIFGYPGGAALHIYDAIFNQSEIQHILVRHEQLQPMLQMDIQEPLEKLVLF